MISAIVMLDTPPSDADKPPLSSERNEPIVVRRKLRVVFQLLDE